MSAPTREVMKTSDTMAQAEDTFPKVIELNVGGVFYTTSLQTLTSSPASKLGQMFGCSQVGSNETSGSGQGSDEAAPCFQLQLPPIKDSKGKYFIDRDGVLFRYVLDFLRNKKLVLPEEFQETRRLVIEAEYFELPSMLSALRTCMAPCSIVPPTQIVQDGAFAIPSEKLHHQPLTSKASVPSPTSPRPSATDLTGLPGTAGTVVIGYRGTFAFGRDGMADVCFRKLTRILVHGKVNLCREVFGDTLNESRDPDRGGMDRYSSRLFLKHTSLEQAFDMLLDQGFILAGSCASATSSSASEMFAAASAVQAMEEEQKSSILSRSSFRQKSFTKELKPGVDSEELRWNHYNEFVWLRK